MGKLTKRTEVGILVKEAYGKNSLKTLYRCYGPEPAPGYGNCDEGYCAVEKLNHYETMEEKGLLLKPKCMPGDYVWEINREKGSVSEYEVASIRYGINKTFHYMCALRKGTYTGLQGFYDKDIGNTVFLTKPEAERALKGNKNDAAFVSSVQMEFSDGIIITDPYYLIKEHWKRDENQPKEEDFRTPEGEKCCEIYQEETKAYLSALDLYMKEKGDEWAVCEYGKRLDRIGITKYMASHTLYGDWDCVLVKTDSGGSIQNDTEKEVGRFSSDSCMVAAADLNQVLAYNPKAAEIDPCCAVMLPMFKGTVEFVIKNNRDGGRSLCITGEGVYKDTGKELYFTSMLDTHM